MISDLYWVQEFSLAAQDQAVDEGEEIGSNRMFMPNAKTP